METFANLPQSTRSIYMTWPDIWNVGKFRGQRQETDDNKNLFYMLKAVGNTAIENEPVGV